MGVQPNPPDVPCQTQITKINKGLIRPYWGNHKPLEGRKEGRKALFLAGCTSQMGPFSGRGAAVAVAWPEGHVLAEARWWAGLGHSPRFWVIVIVNRCAEFWVFFLFCLDHSARTPPSRPWVRRWWFFTHKLDQVGIDSLYVSQRQKQEIQINHPKKDLNGMLKDKPPESVLICQPRNGGAELPLQGFTDFQWLNWQICIQIQRLSHSQVQMPKKHVYTTVMWHHSVFYLQAPNLIQETSGRHSIFKDFCGSTCRNISAL